MPASRVPRRTRIAPLVADRRSPTTGSSSPTARWPTASWPCAGTTTATSPRSSTSTRARELVPAGALGAVLELARRPSRALRRLGPRVVDAGRWRSPLADGRVGRGRRPTARCRAGARCTATFGPSTAIVTLHAARRLTAARHRRSSSTGSTDEHLLSMVFPLDVRADTAACDIQFGHVRRPTHPSTSWDAAKFEVCAHRYVDVSEPAFGVAVLNDGRYGHGLFGGRVRVSLARARAVPRPRRRPRAARGDLATVPARPRPRPTWSPRPSASTRRCGSSTGRRALDAAYPHRSSAHRRRRRDRRRQARRRRRPGDLDRAPPRGGRRPHAGDARAAIAGSSPPACATCSRSRTPGFEVGDGICALTLRPVRARRPLRLTRARSTLTSGGSLEAEVAQCHRAVERDAVDHRRPRRTRPGWSGWRRRWRASRSRCGAAEEHHRAGHPLQHVREVLGAHDRVGHPVHVRRRRARRGRRRA